MNTDSFIDIIRRSPYIYTIGVAGDSGSGKTTFTNAITSIFGDELVSSITVDDYHIYDRKKRAELGITPLIPEASDLDRLADDIAELKRGNTIQKPVYSHEKGTIEEPVPFHPTKFIIIEGLHPFFTDKLRSILDYTIFVDPDKEVKYEWKIQRDVGKRNYSPKQVLYEIEKREPDYISYVLPQRRSANAVIKIGYSQYGKELGLTKNIYQVTLAMNPPDTCLEEIELNIDLCSLFTRSSHDFSVSCTSLLLDNQHLRGLTVDGELMHETIRKIELQIESQTEIHPIDIFTSAIHISASDLIRLIISWLIINHRILINKKL